MANKKLKTAPLREAIFELFWDSPVDSSGLKLDKELELSLGKFQLNVASRFPVYKRTLPPEASIRVYGVPLHQFWSGEVIWPVIQLGPGILTINETEKNYDWEETYRPNILFMIDAFKKSYNVLPTFNRASLKYIDSVDIPDTKNLQNFINENLLTGIENRYKVPGSLSALNLNQVFDIDDAKISVNIQTAVNNVTGSPAIVWITSIIRTGKIKENELTSWIDKAHQTTSDLFVEMLNPDFYASFNK
jgi:uncharacterized protein (TIGR04255 family)